MENKKKALTIDELSKQYNDAKKNFETAKEQFEKAKRDEENRRKEKLASEKDIREKEVKEAIENCKTLIELYIKDYGSFSFERTSIQTLFEHIPWYWWF